MSSTDTSQQSDIAKMKTEPDGSFKRAASTFRSTIVKGGEFEPEMGWQPFSIHVVCSIFTVTDPQAGIISTFPTLVVSVSNQFITAER